MPGGSRFSRHRRWSRRRHQGGAKIADESDAVDCVLKPADVGIQSEATPSICARKRHIGRSRLRLNAEGIPYVFDSEDEASDMEVEADGVGVAAAPASEDMHLKRHPLVARVGSAELPSEGPVPMAADEASEMDLAPEVAARLKEVLSNIDPIYHGVFVSMYKVLFMIRNSKVEIKFVMYNRAIEVETFMHV